MSSIGDRIKEERNRLVITQADFAKLGGVVRRAQQNYENGSRTPDGAYFAKVAEVGIDVLYVITGIRASASASLTPDEAELLNDYRKASPEAKRALRVSGEAFANPPGQVKKAGKKIA